MPPKFRNKQSNTGFNPGLFFEKPSSEGLGIVWDVLPDGTSMGIPCGEKHKVNMKKRLLDVKREVGRGTVDNPKVGWLSSPAREANLGGLEALLMQEASRVGQAYIWVMMGTHKQTTVTSSYDPIEFKMLRVMADDDRHVTVRMGPDRESCTLHGHLYIQTQEADGSPTMRLMTEDERSYVGGRPRHLWVWGPYSNECGPWRRSKIVYPSPPFQLKPGRQAPVKGGRR
ncbi:hypothetical protein F5Y16DRAFT_395405 [Xylariaceae sp. FL0255]|nr:hypothetical protein F5Y16DRAFT_395405 [Xylariaceae sp. FL0255]